MKSCVMFGNCQCMGLKHFLAKTQFGRDYTMQVWQNFQIILKEQDPRELTAAASNCDLFIYQPTPENKYGELSADHYVNNVIPKSARRLSFAYLFNDGYLPLIQHGTDIMGSDYVWRWASENSNGLTDPVLAAYDAGRLDFGLIPRYFACVAEMAKREVSTNIKMAEWMADNRQQWTMFNQNHPTSITFCALAAAVMMATGYGDYPYPTADWNEVGLPCALPLSHYACRAYGLDRASDKESHEHYRRLLIEVLARPPF